ncbi:MAG: hypothetical protein M0041_04720 [Nitrospiraceae bacterium]|nr:hypothetical protein [Nitrospiraceae bacterium]
MKTKVLFVAVTGLVLSGCASTHSYVNPYKAEYPRPTYVSASSCVSGQDALRELIEQLQVTVDATSLSINTSADNNNVLSHSQKAKSVVRLKAGERLRGLIVRHFGNGHCVFVAINKKGAKVSYERDVKEESQKIGELFARLENPGTSALDKLRAAKKLETILKTLRADHDALELLSEHKVHRLHIPAYRMRELEQARGFAVSVPSPTLYVAPPPDSDDFTSMLEGAIQNAGYKVIDPMSDPAFLLLFKLSVREGILDARVPSFPYSIAIAVSIMDRKTGEVLLTRKESKFVSVNSPMELENLVYPRLAQEVKNAVVTPALEALRENAKEETSANTGRDF